MISNHKIRLKLLMLWLCCLEEVSLKRLMKIWLGGGLLLSILRIMTITIIMKMIVKVSKIKTIVTSTFHTDTGWTTNTMQWFYSTRIY